MENSIKRKRAAEASELEANLRQSPLPVDDFYDDYEIPYEQSASPSPSIGQSQPILLDQEDGGQHA